MVNLRDAIKQGALLNSGHWETQTTNWDAGNSSHIMEILFAETVEPSPGKSVSLLIMEQKELAIYR